MGIPQGLPPFFGYPTGVGGTRCVTLPGSVIVVRVVFNVPNQTQTDDINHHQRN